MITYRQGNSETDPNRHALITALRIKIAFAFKSLNKWPRKIFVLIAVYGFLLWLTFSAQYPPNSSAGNYRSLGLPYLLAIILIFYPFLLIGWIMGQSATVLVLYEDGFEFNPKKDQRNFYDWSQMIEICVFRKEPPPPKHKSWPNNIANDPLPAYDRTIHLSLSTRERKILQDCKLEQLGYLIHDAALNTVDDTNHQKQLASGFTLEQFNFFKILSEKAYRAEWTGNVSVKELLG